MRKDEKELKSVVRTARRKERRERQGEGGAKVQVTPMETEKPKKKLSRSQWGNEKVDDLVRKVLGRQRVWKDTEKRKREKVWTCLNECSNTGRSLGKIGRGEPPHEYWEEERRKREKKAKEKVAKEEKKSVEKMIENLIDNLLSATVSEQMKDSISSVRDMKRKGEPSKESKKGTRCLVLHY